MLFNERFTYTPVILWLCMVWASSALGQDTIQPIPDPPNRAPTRNEMMLAQIQALSASNYNDSCQGLNAGGFAYEVPAYASHNSNYHNDGTNYFRQVLADRRVAHLINFLNQLPADEAARKSVQLFDDKLQTHVAGWNEGLETVGAGRKKFIPIEHNAHALRAALFLVAHYCDTATTINKIETWEGAMTVSGSSMYLNPKLHFWIPYFQEKAIPDSNFLVNIIVHTLHRSGKLTPEVIAHARELGMPEVEIFTMVTWDSPVDPEGFASSESFIRSKMQKGEYFVRKPLQSGVAALMEVNCVMHWTRLMREAKQPSKLKEELVLGYLWGLMDGTGKPRKLKDPTPAVPSR